MASLTLHPPSAFHPDSGVEPSPAERRLCAEWKLLQELAALNPARLHNPAADDRTFHLTLSHTPALRLGQPYSKANEHVLRIDYPRYFPAVPLELYLQTPMQHPNIHPQTGFVCLWDAHRITNNVEHAVHKTAAILGWQLLNAAPEHVMQSQAQTMIARRAELASLLAAPLLRGTSNGSSDTRAVPGAMRKRLS